MLRNIALLALTTQNAQAINLKDLSGDDVPDPRYGEIPFEPPKPMAFVLNEADEDLLLTNKGDRDRKPLGVYSVYDDGSIDLAMTRVYLPRIKDPNVIAMYIDKDEGVLSYTELDKDKL